MGLSVFDQCFDCAVAVRGELPEENKGFNQVGFALAVWPVKKGCAFSEREIKGAVISKISKLDFAYPQLGPPRKLAGLAAVGTCSAEKIRPE